MLYNIKTAGESLIPSYINYVITIDDYVLPVLPAVIQRSLRGREEQAYQQSSGGYVQRVYVPGLEELQIDLYLPKVNPMSMTTQRRGMEQVGYDFSSGTFYNHLNDRDSPNFVKGMWLDIAKDPTIIGQNAVIDKMMSSVRKADKVYVVIERIQGSSGTTYGAGRRLMTEGLYVVSAVDVYESAESAMWCILSLSMTEYKHPLIQSVSVNQNMDGGVAGDYGKKLPIRYDEIMKQSEKSSAVTSSSNLSVGCSPRQILAIGGYAASNVGMSEIVSRIPFKRPNRFLFF
jgi:hypothetical protein